MVVFYDGSCASARDQSWADFSDLTEIDGMSLYISRNAIGQITILRDDKRYSLFMMDDPVRCFGFHHWRSSSSLEEPEWLYSAFGFFEEKRRTILQITETSGMTIIQNRETPFVL